MVDGNLDRQRWWYDSKNRRVTAGHFTTKKVDLSKRLTSLRLLEREHNAKWIKESLPALAGNKVILGAITLGVIGAIAGHCDGQKKGE